MAGKTEGALDETIEDGGNVGTALVCAVGGTEGASDGTIKDGVMLDCIVEGNALSGFRVGFVVFNVGAAVGVV